MRPNTAIKSDVVEIISYASLFLCALFHYTEPTPRHSSSSLRGDGSPFRRTQWPIRFSVSNQNWKTITIKHPLSTFLPPPPIAQRLIDWLIDWSANQDASTTFYPEARWGTRLCSIHTDATMLPPPLPPPPPPPLSAHLPITHSPPRSTPTQAWALDRFTSVSTNPSVSRH